VCDLPFNCKPTHHSLNRAGRSGVRITTEPRDFSPLQNIHTGPGAHPSGTGVSFLEVKRPGHGFGHPSPFRAEIKERVQLHILPFWTFINFSRVKFAFTFTHTHTHTHTHTYIYISIKPSTCHYLSMSVCLCFILFP
jgi:hypothetical protein